MKEINKFRAWNGTYFTYWTMNDLCTWDDKDEKPSALDEWQQYTGLKDKNGVEIYEGDILKLLSYYPNDFQERNPHKKHGRIGNGVKWSVKMGCWLLDDAFEKEPTFCGFDENEQWEIIGNTWENPGLLK